MRFIPLLFIWLAIITAVFLPVWGSVDLTKLHNLYYISLFILMIVVAISWNIFYYQGIQKENLAEFELIMLFTPLATVILAEIFLPSERSWTTFIAGLLASVALIFSRFRHYHVRLSMVAKRTMLAMVLMSFESILIKNLLGVFSPVSLYFVRTAVIAIVFVIMYKPKLLSLARDAYALTIVSAIFGVMQMVLKFYGFQNLGVVETTMILLLGPFLVYAFSYLYFQERLYKRDLAAVAIIVVCILYVQFWK
jgi:drug/metabolite transporter (DMT)-like permease